MRLLCLILAGCGLPPEPVWRAEPPCLPGKACDVRELALRGDTYELRAFHRERIGAPEVYGCDRGPVRRTHDFGVLIGCDGKARAAGTWRETDGELAFAGFEWVKAEGFRLPCERSLCEE